VAPLPPLLTSGVDLLTATGSARVQYQASPNRRLAMPWLLCGGPSTAGKATAVLVAAGRSLVSAPP
jgi:hypothetical protein